MQPQENPNLNPTPQPASGARGDLLRGVNNGGRHESQEDAEAMAYAAKTGIDKFLQDKAEAASSRHAEQKALAAGDDDLALDHRIEARLSEYDAERARLEGVVEAVREANWQGAVRDDWAGRKVSPNRKDPLEKAYKAPSATNPQIEDNRNLY